MYSVDLEVLHTSAKWLEQGLRVTLVTVVKTFGSSPRPAGAMLAVCEDGRLVEGLESRVGRWIVAVQCHPERTESTPDEFEGVWADFILAATAARTIRAAPAG